MKRFGHLLLLFLACALVAPGCFSLDDVPPPSAGEERNEITCADGRDNDQDGRIDCEDTDCLMRGFCGEQIPLVPRFEPENTPETCTDGIDNDEDGQFDCGDRDCQAIMELCCSGETDNISCSNRIDDDGNGFADCTDFSCRNNQFVSVCQSEVQCIKFDERGRLIPCTSYEEKKEARTRQCGDGFDNDGDRRTDCNDPDCACTEPCRPGCDLPEENTLESCSDGLDNDHNGFTDCADRQCYDTRMSPPTGAAVEYCSSRQENTVERCSDGIDNDGNGFVDCADFGCSRSPDPEVARLCETSSDRTEDTVERCTDGIDNDGNGYVDCDDNSCRRSTDVTIREACEATFRVCSDRRDNNNNGFTDCADFSCRFYECSYNLSDCTSQRDENNDCMDVHGQPGVCCPIGQSCFQGGCVRVTSPCFEGAFIGSSYVQMGGCPPHDYDPGDPEFKKRQQAMVRAGCTDGIDNDGDGFVDCEDWDCNHNPLAVQEDGVTPLCRGNDGRPLVCR